MSEGGSWSPQFIDLLIAVVAGVSGFVTRIFTFGRSEGRRDGEFGARLEAAESAIVRLAADFTRVEGDLRSLPTKADFEGLARMIAGINDRIDRLIADLLKARV